MIVKPNDVIDKRFRIEILVGRGGWGSVYKARQLDLDRHVAIKFIDGILKPSSEEIERLRREAVALGQLRHKNIVSVLSSGVLNGVPYLVVEYVDGVSLATILEKGRLPPERAMNIVGQTCEALAHAHKHGIVHRDLKPSNLMIAEDPNNGQDVVRVIDFGLARILPSSSSAVDLQSLTQSGMTLGTIAYMSPEQRRSAKVDALSDIYSLGAVLYACLSGSQPGCTGHDVFILSEQLESPTAQDDSKAQLFSDLRLICQKAMCQDPTNRYQSALDLRADLLRATEGKTITAEDVSRPRKHSVRLLPLSIPVLITIVVFLALWPLSRKQAQIIPADELKGRIERLLAKHELREALGLLDEQLTVKPSPDAYFLRARCYDAMNDPRCIDDVRTALGQKEKLDFEWALSDQLLKYQRYSEALLFCDDRMSKHSADKVRWIARKAKTLDCLGEPETASSLLENAITQSLSKSQSSAEATELAVHLLQRYLLSRQYDSARKLTDSIEAITGQSAKFRANQLRQLASGWTDNDNETSLNLCNKALSICDFATEHTCFTDLMALKIKNLRELNKPQALAVAKEFLKIARANMDSSALYTAIHSYVDILIASNDWNGAISTLTGYENELEHRSEDSDGSRVLSNMRRIAHIYRKSGNYRNASLMFQTLIDRDQAMKVGVTRVAEDYSNWIASDYEYYKHTAMDEHFRQAIDCLSKMTPSAEVTAHINSLYDLQIDYETDFCHFEAVEELYRKALYSNPESRTVKTRYANALFKMGRQTEAMRLLEGVLNELEKLSDCDEKYEYSMIVARCLVANAQFNKAFSIIEQAGSQKTNAAQITNSIVDRSLQLKDKYSFDGRYQEAQHLMERVNGILIPTAGVNTPVRICVLCNLALLQQKLNQPDRAMEYYKQAASLTTEYCRQHESFCLQTYSNLLFLQHRYSDSLAVASKVPMSSTLYTDDKTPRNLILSYDPFVHMLILVGHFHEAEEVLHRADSEFAAFTGHERTENLPIMALVQLKLDHPEAAAATATRGLSTPHMLGPGPDSAEICQLVQAQANVLLNPTDQNLSAWTASIHAVASQKTYHAEYIKLLCDEYLAYLRKRGLHEDSRWQNAMNSMRFRSILL